MCIRDREYIVDYPEEIDCDILVIGGGGAGSDKSWVGGGGAGGLIYYNIKMKGKYILKVGNGGIQDSIDDSNSAVGDYANIKKCGVKSEIIDEDGKILFRAMGGSMGIRDTGNLYTEVGSSGDKRITLHSGGSTGGAGYNGSLLGDLYQVGLLSEDNIVNGNNVIVIEDKSTGNNDDYYLNSSYGYDKYGNQYGMFGNRGGGYTTDRITAGGGGAGGKGIDGDSITPGDGGIGKDFSYIFGNNIGDNGWFCGGGGGIKVLSTSNYKNTEGGKGGGGGGRAGEKGEDGLSNTGGGGGASDNTFVGGTGKGGKGGSGSIIIKKNSKIKNIVKKTNETLEIDECLKFLYLDDINSKISRTEYEFTLSEDTICDILIVGGGGAGGHSIGGGGGGGGVLLSLIHI